MLESNMILLFLLDFINMFKRLTKTEEPIKVQILVPLI